MHATSWETNDLRSRVLQYLSADKGLPPDDGPVDPESDAAGNSNVGATRDIGAQSRAEVSLPGGEDVGGNRRINS